MPTWTADEVSVLVEHYCENGSAWDGWDDVLPTHTQGAIADKAHSLGLRCNRPNVPRHHSEVSDENASRAVASLDEWTRLRLTGMVRRADGGARRKDMQEHRCPEQEGRAGVLLRLL